MPITVKHTKVSTIPDDADTSLVRPSDWNADHTLVGLGTMAEQNANAVAITGGTATLTSVTTPIVQATNSAGLALKNSAGNTQMSVGAGGGDNMSINVSTNLNGANAQIDISPTGTGHVHIKPTGVNSVEIAPTFVGEMDNITIGAITPKTGKFTTLEATGNTDLGTGSANYIDVSGGATTVAPVISAQGSDGNIPLVLQPKGTGALQAQLTDSTAAGGNARGANAVDFQTLRSANTMVASGSYSSVLAGRNSTASGTDSHAIGLGCNSSGTGAITISYNGISNASVSVVLGGSRGTSRSIQGNTVFPASNSPIADVSGNSQAALLVLGRQTTDATATVIASNTSAAAATNQITLPNNSAYFFKGEVIAGVTGAGNTKGWSIEGVIKRGAGVGTTALVGSPTVTSLYADAGAATWTVAVTANTTLGCLTITVTGQASTTIRWVAQVRTTEMTF